MTPQRLSLHLPARPTFFFSFLFFWADFLYLASCLPAVPISSLQLRISADESFQTSLVKVSGETPIGLAWVMCLSLSQSRHLGVGTWLARHGSQVSPPRCGETAPPKPHRPRRRPLLLWPHQGRTQPLTAIINSPFPRLYCMVQLLYKKHIKDILWFSNFGDSRTTEMPQRPGWMQRSKHWMYRALLIPNLCFSKIMSKLGKEQMEILKINIW